MAQSRPRAFPRSLAGSGLVSEGVDETEPRLDALVQSIRLGEGCPLLVRAGSAPVRDEELFLE